MLCSGATYCFYNFILSSNLLYPLSRSTSRAIFKFPDEHNNKFATPKYRKLLLIFWHLGGCCKKVRKTGAVRVEAAKHGKDGVPQTLGFEEYLKIVKDFIENKDYN